MQHTESARGWGLAIIIVHWLTALVVFGMFASGLWMVGLNYYSSWYKTAPFLHKSVGILLLLVTLLRIVLRLKSSRPVRYGPRKAQYLASVVHIVIYVLLFALFFSGYLISTADGRGIDVFGWFSVPALGQLFENQEDVAGDIHFYVAWTLIGLVCVHALGALKHHFLDKHPTLKLMLGLQSQVGEKGE
ncbi:cytochrome b [Alteromonas aestuariivivens]|uniref:Cytochrome b n=1 Tax=Alteromonas aestuariivivens TaxID=1938339 RepID=A0A3D8M9X1_9ALTE|nr:cytochrome b [Alteromonas aestuariivivens]RDV26779.1 cytochrome b [Alteromonas aestuariivivens]